jgi:hypothetical protein
VDTKKRTRKSAKSAKKVLVKKNLPLTKKKMEQIKGGAWFIGRGQKPPE